MSTRKHKERNRRAKGRPDLSKHQAQQIHAIRQGAERHGLTLAQIVELRQSIQAGRSKAVRRQSNRVTVHDVELGDRTIRCIYDSERHEIVTFLPTPKATP